jgi:hypothetical protein
MSTKLGTLLCPENTKAHIIVIAKSCQYGQDEMTILGTSMQIITIIPSFKPPGEDCGEFDHLVSEFS